jgi:hypothetical protein
MSLEDRGFKPDKKCGTFMTNYDSLKSKLEEDGFLPDNGNYAMFSKCVNGVKINVAAQIPTYTVVATFGDQCVYDNIYQYQVWAEKNGTTVASICSGGIGKFSVNDITSAVSELEKKFGSS